MTKVKSVCPYCGVGCGIIMDVADNRIVKISGDKSHPTNFGRLCTKGSMCNQPVAAAGRAAKAYVRAMDGRDAGLSVDQAIGEIAARLSAILDAHGSDAISFYVSGQMSLEAQYLANKLCKGFIGTNNIESNSRLCMASAASGYKLSLGADGPPGSYQDFDRADLFFVIGANMADCHPILFLRMMDRVKKGAKLIVVDPRRSATAGKADLFLQIRPGTDLALLNGLLHLLLRNGAVDEAFISAFTEGWDAMPGFLDDYPPERVAAACRPGRGRHPHRRRMDRCGTGVDELLDDGAQPEHPRHLEHQRDLQSASCDRQDMSPRQRPLFPDGPAQRDGRARDGLYGAGLARAAFNAERGRSGIRGGCLADTRRSAAGGER